jgi:hypothetical protein
MKQKCLAVGIILLFIGTCITTAIAPVTDKPLVAAGNSPQKKTNVMQDNPIIGHIPDDGLYWNDRKIAEYPVPLFLHYHFKYRAHFYPMFIFNDNGSGISKVEFYVDGVLIGTQTSPPWTFTFRVTVTPFHHSQTFGIKVYFGAEQNYSDNVTIYRLFP